MSRQRKDLGERGEAAALAYLRAHGYHLLEKNHRRRWGEIDLILRQGPTLVFCEVKTSQLGMASESYTAKQQRRARKLVLAYLARTDWRGPLRVDLLALDREADSAQYRVHHFQDVLSTDDAW